MNLRAKFFLILSLILAITLSACHGHQSSSTNSSPQSAQATPSGLPISNASPQVSPAATQPANKSAKSDGVPDIMKRPMTPEETKKAMEALPPEVRARLQGLGQKPVSPTPTVTPKK